MGYAKMCSMAWLTSKREDTKKLEMSHPPKHPRFETSEESGNEDSASSQVGTDGGGRTHTLVRVPDFESSASANSATSATRQSACKLPAKLTRCDPFSASFHLS